MIAGIPVGWVIEPMTEEQWEEVDEPFVEDAGIRVRNESTGEVLLLLELLARLSREKPSV